MRRGLSWILLCAVLLATAGTWTAVGQLSGFFGLDIIARRIPTTLTGEIKLDTPSEFAMLEFGIASQLDIQVSLGYADVNIDAAVNMAGPEHLILDAVGQFDEIDLYGMMIDRLSIVPELWFAVPFESVSDVNGLPNAVVIPPGDPLFVAGRLTGSWQVGGFAVKQLLMLEDINFPNPGGTYTRRTPGLPWTPIYYGTQSQSFAAGSLTYVSWRAQLGVSVSSVTGINASQAATSVKGHSASGRPMPGKLFQTLSIGGIRLDDMPIGDHLICDPTIGLSFTMGSTTECEGDACNPCDLCDPDSTVVEEPSGTLSFSAKVMDIASLSASLTIIGGPIQLGGVTLSGTSGPFRFAFALDKLALNSLSAGASTSLNLGAMTGNFGASFTGLEKGLTGMSLRLSVAQGVLSAATSVSYAQRGEQFGFASLSTQITFRLSPGTISIQATFGRYGLTRAAISTGVSF